MRLSHVVKYLPGGTPHHRWCGVRAMATTATPSMYYAYVVELRARLELSNASSLAELLLSTKSHCTTLYIRRRCWCGLGSISLEN